MTPCLPRLLMSGPFFGLAKRPASTAVVFTLGDLAVRVTSEHTNATIWDADILIWAISALKATRYRNDLPPGRFRETRHALLAFLGRTASGGQYERLPAALDRLATTRVTITPGTASSRAVSFTWLSEWSHRGGVIELRIADWLRDAALAPRAVLALDPRYFALKGGLERRLYLLARRHAGRQPGGWSFDLAHLRRKTGIAPSVRDFPAAVARIVRRQSLPGYRLTLEGRDARVRLHFRPETAWLPASPVDNSVDNLWAGCGEVGPARLSTAKSTPIAVNWSL
ncbi:replication initiator protein A [Gluconacetobacter diazotrophicus]|uniref:RepA replication protein n=2 Tax=Gluconacetobacter diazotrophicus TaxID=33996 RepID=A0A7W4FFI0_GLUDI|nr:replication initiator protein A [Gluconacetobacter diazotrophicus]MBB2156584.1 RepA replication protein [Gluconacetobacter diazotrophicus]CAP56812.1 putative replication protein A [Gluconacetobacter diazotrophicus PA1 5]